MVQFFMALVGAALLSAAPSVSAQACGCPDIGDMQRRIAEATTALNAYTAEVQKMMEQTMRTRQPIAYTPERRALLQSRIQTALNNAQGGAIATAPTDGDNPGGTSNLCTISLNFHPSATACMRESVTRHEKHHQDECLKMMKRPFGGVDQVVTGRDRFQLTGAQLSQYASEEITSYMTEITFLQGELARLQSTNECAPKPKPAPAVRDYTAQPRQRRP